MNDDKKVKRTRKADSTVNKRKSAPSAKTSKTKERVHLKNEESKSKDKKLIENNDDKKIKKTSFNTLEVIIIMFITLCFGAILGSALTYAVDSDKKIISTIPKEMDEFINTYEDIVKDYYEDIDREGLLDAGIKGMLGFLGDKYSVYMDKEASQAFNEQVEGIYVGIGSEIKHEENGDLVISNPYVGGPADKAGIRNGDILLKVNGKDISDLSLTEVSKLVKGKKGTSVTLNIKRGDEVLDIKVTRDEVEISSVSGKIIDYQDKKIGYIDIDIFAANSYKQFKKVLLDLESQEMESLIIDVRSNSGGYLTTVEDVLSLFLEKGKIIYQLDTKGDIEVKKDNTRENRNYKVVVLTDGGSASASEILAAGFKEAYDNGTIMGTHTYGKGTVQKAYDLESGATVKYTIQKWLTPDGTWIEGKGVLPDVEVKLSEEYYENPVVENDNQLQEALKYIIEK